MIIEAAPLKDAFIIIGEPRIDDRGYFSRIYSKTEFKQVGLNTNWVQVNKAFNDQLGILRGLHFQTGESAEIKYVSCLLGSIYDVIVDLRSDSPTFCKWYGVELSEANHKALYVPKGFAHGYQTLSEQSLVWYLVSSFYDPHAESGVRWNDPRFRIVWPELLEGRKRNISDKDNQWKDYDR